MGLTAAFVLGLISALALAPVSWPVCFLLGFAAFTVLLRHTHTLRLCFWRAFLYALGFHLAGLYWISASLFVDIHRYIWVLPFSLLALPAYLAIIFGLACCVAHFFRARPIIHVSVLASVVFISEFLRGILFTGFPWNLPGYIWSETLPLAQGLSLIGIHGLTFLTLLAAAALSLLFPKAGRAEMLLLATLGLIFSGLTLWGEQRLADHQTRYQHGVTLRLVQAAIQQSERKTTELRRKSLERLKDLSAEPSQKRLSAVIWPETASPFILAADDDARRYIAQIVPPRGALLTGTPGMLINGADKKYFNSLAVLDGNARIIGLYDKARLVPFGEFVPFRGILKNVPIAADVIGSADFSPGPGPRTLRAPGLPPFSPLICYEAIYSHGVIDRRDPPAWLLQITNDAWFGETSGPYQHFAMARMRAIEEGLPLVRSANTGISAVVDAYGRTLMSLDLGTRGILDAPLPQPVDRATLFSQIGFAPTLFLALIWLILSLAAFFRLRKG